MTLDERANAEERKTAVHEAGHAVAACLQNVPFECVWILSHEEFEQMERNPSSQVTKPQGEVIIEHTGMLKFTDADGVCRPTHDTRKAMDAYIVYSLAGRVAEAVLCGGRADSRNDTDMVKLHAELDDLAGKMRESGDHRPVDWLWVSRRAERNAYIERMRADTVVLITRYQAAVKALATALLARRVLSRAEVAVLVDRWARAAKKRWRPPRAGPRRGRRC